jgi:ribulose 1,5-bisphosphate synthetase/thiazole synthase
MQGNNHNGKRNEETIKQIKLSAKAAPVIREVDVLVVGGGPAGIGAAVAAAYDGCQVLLLEKNGFLGGNITKSYVETCNYFMKGTSFQANGVYAKMEAKYRQQYGSSHDIRPDSPHRFSSEYLKIFLDKFLIENQVTVWFHSFVNEVVLDGDAITAAVIQTKQGPQAVAAKVIVDCTGDGDVAFAAGVSFEQGRERDQLCQPGTVNFRIAGVNAALFLENGQDKLKEIGTNFRLAYRQGKTGLRCKRQDLPFGRLTPGGQITYINYPCAYGIDPTDIKGLTQGEMECREYISEMITYLREQVPGMEGVELASIATEIGFRDSRRIIGHYHLTIEDMKSSRHFSDCIAVFPQFYDMLSPDAKMNGDGSLAGSGYDGHIFVPIQDESIFEIPYRSLIPEKITNLLVAGRCISCDHVAQSGVRAISLCMQTGEAAGSAAALATQAAVPVAQVEIAALQERLKKQGVPLTKGG